MDAGKIAKFAGMIRESRSTVFFGGAGVSTESGVKDYRSENGLYNTVKQYGVSPEEILSHSFFFDRTDLFYDFFDTYFLGSAAAPNPAHLALAELERRGMLDAVITQNIDGLHQAAGSCNVLELHGTVYRYHCARCNTAYAIGDIRDRAEKIPRCKKCGGIIKPDVVLYGENLDEDVIDRALLAMERANLLIVGGTSLAVYPAAGFLRYFRGDHVVLINRDGTPYDGMADLIFREPIGQVMAAVMEELGGDFAEKS